MLRITSGEFRGRYIQTPPGEKTRPTRAQLRLALFNSVQTSLPGSRVLDLFAGSGALGFEALSRGAETVVFVESNRSVTRLIDRNARDLGVTDRVTVLSDPVEKALPRVSGPFDLVLADPPYAAGWEMKLLVEAPWESLLVPGGLFCLEWGAQKSRVEELPDRSGILVKVREKTYGDSVLTTYRREDAGDAT